MSAILSTGAGTASTASEAADSVRIRLEDLREESLRSQAEVVAGLAEDGQDPVLLARHDSLTRTLEDIRVALARVEAGTYGRCVRCGREIPAARLELRPFATSCVPCADAR